MDKVSSNVFEMGKKKKKALQSEQVLMQHSTFLPMTLSVVRALEKPVERKTHPPIQLRPGRTFPFKLFLFFF